MVAYNTLNNTSRYQEWYQPNRIQDEYNKRENIATACEEYTRLWNPKSGWVII